MITVPDQPSPGAIPQEETPHLSDALIRRLEATAPMDMLPPAERREFQDLLDESARVRVEAQDDARRLPRY